MPNSSGLALTGAELIALANQARMAMSVLHLFKVNPAFTPSATTLKAEYQANECDFDGYAPKTIATFGTPVLFGTGYATYAPTQTFYWVFDSEGVQNACGGWWLETAAGVVVDYGVFDPGVPVQGPGQAVIVTPLEYTPAGAILSL